MTINDINITTVGVIESTIVYGIVHGIWTAIKWCLRQLESETGQIIEAHVRSGHDTRFKYCLKGACSKLGIARGLIPREVVEPDSV